jgi:hypothetical protein
VNPDDDLQDELDGKAIARAQDYDLAVDDLPPFWD